MPQTQMQCPNCRQPIIVDVQQIFDVSRDPNAKQRLLSGAPNLAQCPHCGYQGPLMSPLVYHDPQKELLLTFVPPELGLSRDEQERLIGSLIRQVMDSLPQEQRKAYLFSPQTMLTYQGLVERILEADGITKEMIEAQQQKVRLIERLLTVADDTWDAIIEQEKDQIDADFFAILQRLGEAAMATGDENALRRIVSLQQKLLDTTEFGQELKTQKEEIDAAVASLREAGEGLTREKLLDLLVEAPSEARLGTLVSLARPVMDYTFFQMLTERIEQATGEERERLEAVRDKVLAMTREIDEEVQTRVDVARRNLDILLQAPDLERAVFQNLEAIDQVFVDVVQDELQKARQAGDLERSSKLSQVLSVLEKASGAKEIAFLEELLEIEDDAALEAALASRQDVDFRMLAEVLASFMAQAEQMRDQRMYSRLERILGVVLHHVTDFNAHQGHSHSQDKDHPGEGLILRL